MKTKTFDRPARAVPFTLSFVERLDQALYDEAIKGSEILKQSYDPETQTSNIPIYAGTSLTYDNTNSGPLMGTDDSRESDT
ncbi:hypothetical protein [Planktothrix agardhii]|uniref:hypothetical protein n=1 Tax=Planktothrix agardhii TaxID=1160 RepID=UPI00047FC936|nr:hypothetical protein [Planktothrix agardhii]